MNELKLQEIQTAIIKLNLNNTDGHLLIHHLIEPILFIKMYELGYIDKHILDAKMNETLKRYNLR